MLLVVASHVSLTRGFPATRWKPFIDRLGTTGVDVFFVLSGFLITSLLCRELHRTKRISLRAFYFRRALRIFPAYACFLLFVLALSLTGRAEIARGDWLAALTYTMNFRENPAWELGHVWSLSIEEHFYLLWPPLFAWLPRRAAITALCGVLVVEPMLRIAILSVSPALAITTELWTFTRIDPIAAGCLLALVSRTAGGFDALDRSVRFWPLAVLLVLGCVAGSILSGKIDTGVAPSVSVLGLVVIVWAAVRRAPRALEGRVASVIGIGSYSLYLWQEIFLNPHRAESWARFPQNLVLVPIFALLSYRIVERPFLRIKDRRALG